MYEIQENQRKSAIDYDTLDTEYEGNREKENSKENKKKDNGQKPQKQSEKESHKEGWLHG